MSRGVTTRIRHQRLGVPEVAAGLLGAAGSTIAYRELSSVLVDDGTFTPAPDFSTTVLRSNLLTWVGWTLLAGAVVLALVAWRRRDRVWPRGVLGCALFGAGITWFAWSSLEMHVVGAYDWSGGGSELVGDLLYHGGGALVAGVGWFLLLPGFAPASEA